jgi:hypothetical protein
MHFATRVMTWRVARLCSVQCSVQWNSSVAETARNRTHVHIHLLCLEWQILWPPRVLTFLPGTPYILPIFLINVEQMVEWELARETGAPGKPHPIAPWPRLRYSSVQFWGCNNLEHRKALGKHWTAAEFIVRFGEGEPFPVSLLQDPHFLSVSSKTMRCTGNISVWKWRHSDLLRGGWDVRMEVLADNRMEGWAFSLKGYCSGNALGVWFCSLRYLVQLSTQLLAVRLYSFIYYLQENVEVA